MGPKEEPLGAKGVPKGSQERQKAEKNMIKTSTVFEKGFRSPMLTHLGNKTSPNDTNMVTRMRMNLQRPVLRWISKWQSHVHAVPQRRRNVVTLSEKSTTWPHVGPILAHLDPILAIWAPIWPSLAACKLIMPPFGSQLLQEARCCTKVEQKCPQELPTNPPWTFRIMGLTYGERRFAANHSFPFTWRKRGSQETLETPSWPL